MLSIKGSSKGLGGFLNFLQRISEKKKGEDVDTIYRNLKVYFIGRNELLKKHGVAPYYKRIVEDFRNGTDVVYLLALENYHVAAASVLSKLLSENGVALIDDKYIGKINFKGKEINTAVIRMICMSRMRDFK